MENSEKFWRIVNPDGFYWDGQREEWTSLSRASMFCHEVRLAYERGVGGYEFPESGKWEEAG